MKHLLPLTCLVLLTSNTIISQTLNQSANWPNENWTITGDYLSDPNIFEANPTVDSNFAYDDDDAGGGHSDNIQAESSVIDLTDAFNADETWLTIYSTYVYNNGNELLRIQYWDNDAAEWYDWGSDLNETINPPNNNFCSGPSESLISEKLNIAGFTPNQLSNFKYRFSYNDNGSWGWGFCFSSPTIVSEIPPVCPNVTSLSVTNISLNTADVYWQAGNTETSWEIAIQSPGTGTPSGSGALTNSNNPYEASGLTQGTSYEVYVRGYCGGSDYSNWVGPINFTTLFPSRVNFSAQSISVSGGYDLTVVDMNGDYLDDIVSASTTNVNIHYQMSTGGFTEVNITTPAANFLPGWSMAAGDIDKNGYTDLLYGSGSGVTFMKANVNLSNVGNGNPYDDIDGFTEMSGSEYVFSQRSNFADINNDGELDAFVCHDIDANVYYINDGDGNFTFYQGGLGNITGNYGSIWIDYDNDRDLDMFIAKCGSGPINQMLTNNGDGTFTENATALGLADGIQTWSSSWGDYDNDGDMDLFIGASSGSHKLMRNNGDYSFTNITASAGNLSDAPTGHESVSYDVDNDGNLDIICNGVILYGNGDLTFTETDNDEIPYKNGSFGDLNNDGFIDTYYANSIYFNNTTPNNWIKINTVGTASNINGIGARVELVTDSGTQIRDVRSGEGFEFMSTLNTHFGIGTNTEIISLTIRWPSGIIDQIIDPSINQAITVNEGDHPLSIQDVELLDLTIHPNPVENTLFINSDVNLNDRIATVFDVNGKLILNKRLTENLLDVSKLQSGIYILRLESNGKLINRKFIKK